MPAQHAPDEATLKPAVAYVRISQDKAGESLGVDRQLSEIEYLAERLGFCITQVYRDNDKSATSGAKRPEFERLLNDRPPVIFVWHMDRLVRLTRELERVLDIGSAVYSVAGGNVDLSTPAGRAVAKTIVTWANYEVEQKQVRQRSERKQYAEAGKPAWSVAPFGYTRTGEIVEEEAAAIREAFEFVLNGGSISHVARVWSEKFPTTRGGTKWHPASVWHVLKNPRYIGERWHNGALVAKATWEPIVSEEVYRAVEALLGTRATGHSRQKAFLLTGLGLCPKCGSTLHVGMMQNRRGTSGPYRIYRCSAQAHFHRKLDLIDPEVIDRTIDVMAWPVTQENILSNSGSIETAALVAERAELEHRRDVEFPEAIAQGLSVTQIATATQRINARIADINATLLADSGNHWLRDAYAMGMPNREHMREHFTSAPLHEQQNTLRLFWHSITPGAGRGAPVDMQPTELTKRLTIAHAQMLGAKMPSL